MFGACRCSCANSSAPQNPALNRPVSVLGSRRLASSSARVCKRKCFLKRSIKSSCNHFWQQASLARNSCRFQLKPRTHRKDTHTDTHTHTLATRAFQFAASIPASLFWGPVITPAQNAAQDQIKNASFCNQFSLRPRGIPLGCRLHTHRQNRTIDKFRGLHG